MNERMDKKKRRFGVSIPEDVAISLDFLAEKLEMDRSRIVSDALELYIRDHAHYSTPHECCGVITLASHNLKILEIIEEFRDVIQEFSHVHTANVCVNALIVSGPSSRIAELHKKLMPFGNLRFIPMKSCREINEG